MGRGRGTGTGLVAGDKFPARAKIKKKSSRCVVVIHGHRGLDLAQAMTGEWREGGGGLGGGGREGCRENVSGVREEERLPFKGKIYPENCQALTFNW